MNTSSHPSSVKAATSQPAPQSDRPDIGAVDLRLQPPEVVSRIRIGSGLTERVFETLSAALADNAPPQSIFIVSDQVIASTYGRQIADELHAHGLSVNSASLPADESHKTLTSVEWLYAQFIHARLDRSSVIIAVGGGVIGDVTGFAAATFLRGLRFVNIPTTLLSMVDASVGGKNGVNCIIPAPSASETSRNGEPETSGTRMFLAKNLVGAFHQPSLVLIDPAVLRSLPDRDYTSGLAECVKHAIIADESLFAWMENNAQPLKHRDMNLLPEFIERNVRIKAQFVQRDEREAGERMHLNLGHTFAHAIETRPELGLSHGEAVAIGLIAASAAANHLNYCSSDHLHRVQTLIASLGLPVNAVDLPSDNDLIAAMRRDKKVINDHIRLVLPVGFGAAKIVEADEAAFKAGWRAVRV